MPHFPMFQKPLFYISEIALFYFPIWVCQITVFQKVMLKVREIVPFDILGDMSDFQMFQTQLFHLREIALFDFQSKFAVLKIS